MKRSGESLITESVDEFVGALLDAVRAGGNADCGQKCGGRYPRTYGISGDRAAVVVEVGIWHSTTGGAVNGVRLIESPPFDCSTPEGVEGMYTAVARGGGAFNDSSESERALALAAREGG